jgi:hypothetical protein
LAKSTFTVDPSTWFPIQEDDSLPGAKQITHPSAPGLRETLVMEDGVETVPGDTVKSFMKVELEDDSGATPFIAAVKEISSVNKIVSKAPAQDEARLI